MQFIILWFSTPSTPTDIALLNLTLSCCFFKSKCDWVVFEVGKVPLKTGMI